MFLSPIAMKGTGEKMKITVITGSLNENSASMLLASQFIKGAAEAGHDVFRFDTAFQTVQICLGCGRCGRGLSDCVRIDAMMKLTPELITSEVVVFATQLDRSGLPENFDRSMDRIFINSARLIGGARKVILMVAINEADSISVQAFSDRFKTLIEHLQWDNRRTLIAEHCKTQKDIENTDYFNQAYRLGGGEGL